MNQLVSSISLCKGSEKILETPPAMDLHGARVLSYEALLYGIVLLVSTWHITSSSTARNMIGWFVRFVAPWRKYLRSSFRLL